MTGEDPYSAWKRRRSAVEVSEGFADGVMRRIRQDRQQAMPSVRGPIAALRSSRIVAAALLLLGFLIGVLRPACIVQLVTGLCAEGR